MYYPIPDAQRSDERFRSPASGSCVIVSMPPYLIVGAAIRAAKRGAAPSVLASLASDLEALVKDGDCAAPFVLTWFRVQSEGSAEGTVKHEETAHG